uniref:Putative tigger transposable element n=1 Tax=Amblyomma aureolatum TaxID=187763 RepID=A0A1E1X330_9ACAR
MATATPAKRPQQPANDLERKVKILKELNEGISRQEVMKKYGVKRSTLSDYVKNKEKIFEAFDSGKFTGKRKRLRTAAHPKLEEALLRWITDMRDGQLPLSGPLICQQADRYAQKMNIESFSASEGWFARFKERHGLVFRNVCGEKAAVDERRIADWKTTELLQYLARYEPADVFNADETALFFKALPDKTITFKGDPCVGGKRSKERVTVLLASNMSGTERLPLLVIGKAKNPRCFKNIPRLPVEYRANRKAWMTSDIFQAWLRQLDRRFSANKRKVLLVVDNCSAHTRVTGLECIELVFLPPNTTAALQPLDQGIIQHVKCRYRKHVLERMLLCKEAGREYYDLNLLSAIHILVQVWNNTPAEVIANSFRHSGFVRPDDCDVPPEVTAEDTPEPTENMDNEEVDDRRFEFLLPSGVQLADYVAIDDDAAVAGLLTDADILSEVLDGDENHSDEDDRDPPSRRRTVQEAAEALAVLEEFCVECRDSERAHHHLMGLKKIVLAQIPATRQTKITQFFMQ